MFYTDVYTDQIDYISQINRSKKSHVENRVRFFIMLPNSYEKNVAANTDNVFVKITFDSSKTENY